jgi:hypothetical protein
MSDNNLEVKIAEEENKIIERLESMRTTHMEIPEWISEDYTIKSGVYNIDHDIRVWFGRLTIEKGTTLNFSKGKKIFVGIIKAYNQSENQDSVMKSGSEVIIANGTEDEPILLQAKTSSWGGICIYGSKENNLFRYTTIRNAQKNEDGEFVVGGGINIQQSKLTLENSLIEHCDAKLYGGGISSESSEVKIRNTIIRNSSASQGGGLAGYASNIEIENTIVESNSANMGGGIQNWGGSEIRIKNSKIRKNKASFNGGGIYNEKSDLKIEHTTIKRNQSDISGGGIYCSESSLRIEDITITRNRAAQRGGGLEASKSSVTGDDNLICFNKAGSKSQASTQVGFGGGVYLDDSKFIGRQNIACFNRSNGGSGVFSLDKTKSNCITFLNYA